MSAATALVAASHSFVVAEDPRPIHLDRPVEATLAPLEEHVYRFDAAAGRCLAFEVEQEGIDVRLERRLAGHPPGLPDDRRSSGTEIVVDLPDRSGSLDLVVTAAVARAPAGRYRLRVRELPTDRARSDACRLHLLAQSTAERDAFERAAESWDGAGEPLLAAFATLEIARLSLGTRDLARAMAAAEDASLRFEALARPVDRLASRMLLGRAHELEGNWRASWETRNGILAEESSLTPADRVDLRFHLGLTAKELGDFDVAIARLEEAREAFRAFGMESAEFLSRVELTSVHVMRRDPLRALEEATRGLVDARERNRPDMEARFLQRMGNVYWDLGDDDQAAANWRLALDLHRASKNPIGEAAVLLQLGDYAARRGERTEAQASYERALEILRAAGSKLGEARALTRLGTAIAAKGDTARASEIQRQALEIVRSQGNKQSEVLALVNLGRTRIAAGDREEGASLLTAALDLTRAEGSGIGETQILAELARLRADEGSFDRALSLLDEGIDKAESAQKAALVPSLRATLGADAQPLYAARTEILMRRHLAAPKAGWDAKGFESAERARGRALLALLAESAIDLERGVDPAAWSRYRSLQEKRAAATDARAVAEIEASIRVVEGEIRKESPSFAALTQPEPLGVDAVRRRVLDDDTVLVEYALGEGRSWMWALTRAELVSAPLPPAEEIEALARRVYRGMSSPSGEEAEAERELARILLGPIEGKLSGPWRGKRLAIVSMGALDYVPFGALPATPGPRLIHGHEVVRLPSASVVDALRRAKRRPDPASKVALLGDPVFTGDDPRVRRPTGASAARSGTKDPVALSALAAGGPGGFPRLPFSRQEVLGIAALLPDGEAFVATDFRASRALLLDGAVARHRIVHLASHGLLNTAHPELSGIVLSLVDESGEPQDGFLRLQDIYNLRLAADLVVLSGCHTALGREVAGEGFVGLTRGFLHAGARRVLASAWKVDDDATAALMVAFYRNHLREGLSPAAALRAAQREMASRPGRGAPYFWAGFSLFGDWR